MREGVASILFVASVPLELLDAMGNPVIHALALTFALLVTPVGLILLPDSSGRGGRRSAAAG